MIEVEKKFQPTEEQKKRLIDGAALQSIKEVIDIYYDTSSYDFAKRGMWLRERDGDWELKVYMNKKGTTLTEAADEIVEEKKILKKLGYEGYGSVNDLMKDKLVLLARILTKREKYSRDGFIIDFDETDFGLIKTDIEKLVNDESEIEAVNKKIIDWAAGFDLREVDLPLKPAEYLRRTRPEVYREIFFGNENKELKIR